MTQRAKRLAEHLIATANELLQELEASTGYIEKMYGSSTKLHHLVSPDGVPYVTNNINAFSKEYNLTQASMSKLVNGYLKSHRGWKLDL